MGAGFGAAAAATLDASDAFVAVTRQKRRGRERAVWRWFCAAGGATAGGPEHDPAARGAMGAGGSTGGPKVSGMAHSLVTTVCRLIT